jgi:hypothetical protein
MKAIITPHIIKRIEGHKIDENSQPHVTSIDKNISNP